MPPRHDMVGSTETVGKNGQGGGRPSRSRQKAPVDHEEIGDSVDLAVFVEDGGVRILARPAGAMHQIGGGTPDNLCCYTLGPHQIATASKARSSNPAASDRLMPCKPASRIKGATRLRLTRIPWAAGSTCTRAAPYVPRELSWMERIATSLLLV